MERKLRSRSETFRQTKSFFIAANHVEALSDSVSFDGFSSSLRSRTNRLEGKRKGTEAVAKVSRELKR